MFQPVSAHHVRGQQFGRIGNADLGQRRLHGGKRKAGADLFRIHGQGLHGADDHHLIDVGGPHRHMGKHLQDALHHGLGILDVLGRDGPPLGQQAARRQAFSGQFVEIRGVKIDHAPGRGRGRLQGDQVKAPLGCHQVMAAVADMKRHPWIGRRIQIAVEQGRRLDRRRHQFGAFPMGQGIGQQRPRGDAGAQTDHQGGPRRTVMNDERQQPLQPHVAQRRQGIAGVGNTLDIEAAEGVVAAFLLKNGNRAFGRLVIKNQLPAPGFGQHPAELVGGCKDGQKHHNGNQAGGQPIRSSVGSDARAADHHSRATDQHSGQGQQGEGVNQTQSRNEDKSRDQCPPDPAGGVPGRHHTEVSTDPSGSGNEPDGGRKRRA